MNYVKTGGQTITGAIKPATRPKYNPVSMNEALMAAARVTARHECPMYVFPTYYAWKVSWKKPDMVEAYFKVEGRGIEYYESESRVRIRALEDS